ncbi:Integrase, catalytic region [Legionella waltersii]|uniref:Integrase, catalytic region n=1 Tax=Legionella waltersii TaxID=66969 RepID=A0A0W1AC85_9GAMM|nr:IS3 family transposase [Legionella waltersii]KTD78965.1 Integrase, catalytic region [Legionella waltersii]SNV03481.1 Integrase, catalytic region [Legionella waltersii]SNV07442.1 Integrase, catalytic region [Legionella waltersii]
MNVDNKDISLRRQCTLLGVNRSTLYYASRARDVDDVGLLNEIRDIWNKYPFYGYRRITIELRKQGRSVNRKRVQRLMALGGIYAIYPGPNTSRRNKRHAVHRYLLRDIEITRPNQAWMVDITYLRLESGFVYLVALIDVHSRYIVGWSLSTTLETEFCMDALKSALKNATPEIINSDQGCQFTSEEWVSCLQEHGIQISMTGKGRCLDNAYIERFWRNIKREEFYLNAYDSIKNLKKEIAKYMNFYNHVRPHQALRYNTPASFYFNEAPAAAS